MTASLTSIRVIIPDEIGLGIIQAPEPLKAYRQYLLEEHKLDPKGILNYDLENLRRGAVITLGEKALKDMGLPVPTEKE